jgi:hypothetical protein
MTAPISEALSPNESHGYDKRHPQGHGLEGLTSEWIGRKVISFPPDRPMAAQRR